MIKFCYQRKFRIMHMDKCADKNKLLLRKGGKEVWLPLLKTASQSTMELRSKYSAPCSTFQEPNTPFLRDIFLFFLFFLFQMHIWARFIYLFLIDFYWSIVPSQYCVSFCCTTKRISHKHTHVPISPPS